MCVVKTVPKILKAPSNMFCAKVKPSRTCPSSGGYSIANHESEGEVECWSHGKGDDVSEDSRGQAHFGGAGGESDVSPVNSSSELL